MVTWHYLYSTSLIPSVLLFHFFSKITDRIDMKFYMGFLNHKAQRTNQDWVCGMHNYAEISIVMGNREI